MGKKTTKIIEGNFSDVFGDQKNKDRIGAEIFSSVIDEINPARKLRIVFLRIAAAVFLIGSAGLFSIKYFQASKPEQTTLSWKVIHSEKGKTRTVVLADGSMVILHSEARVAIPSNFGAKKRTVRLSSGEAYFKIKKDAAHPFIVHSGPLEVKVLGTAFNIKNSTRSKETEVSVSEGKVQVAHNNQRLALLTKGKRITYQTTSDRFILDLIPLTSVAAWSKKYIELDNVSFRELSEVFQSFYGWKLDATNPNIRQFRYTLTIDKKNTALSTLKIIAKIHGLNFKEKDGKVMLQE